MKKQNMIIFFLLIIICILAFSLYVKQGPRIPIIKSVELLDMGNNPLPEANGWITLHKESKIKVSFEGPATHMEFYSIPITTVPNLPEEEIIGRAYFIEGDREFSYIWNVPEGFKGYIYVLVYNDDVARSSKTEDFFIKAIYWE